MFYTCSYLSSELPQREIERENKERREEGRMKERGKGKEGSHAIKTQAKPVTPAFQSICRGWRGGEGGFSKGEKAGIDVYPFCKIKPVDSQQPQTWIFEDLLV